MFPLKSWSFISVISNSIIPRLEVQGHLELRFYLLDMIRIINSNFIPQIPQVIMLVGRLRQLELTMLLQIHSSNNNIKNHFLLKKAMNSP